MIRTTMQRRAFIRTLGLGLGGALIAPFLERQLARAQGEAEPNSDRPSILVNLGAVFGWSVLGKRGADGEPYRIYQPSSPQLTASSLPEIFEPLSGYASQALLVSGLSREGFGNFHGSMRLGTGLPSKGAGASYDVLIGEQVGKEMPLERLSWRLGYHSDVTSYTLGGHEIPAYRGVGDMYKALFGEAGSPALERKTRGQKLIMDGLRGDLLKVRERLAAPEIEALDQYESSMDRLSSRLENTLRVQCPDLTLEERPEAEAAALEQDYPSGNVYRWAQRCYSDMALMAVQCGLTKMITMYPISGQDDGRRYDYVPYQGKEEDAATFHDGICHSHHGGVNPTGHPSMVRHQRFCAESMRYLMDGLGQISLDPDTLALERAVGVWHNHGGAWHHNVNEFVASKNHVAMVIDGTSRTFATGQHLDLPWDDSTHHAQFFQTIMEGFGVDASGFGDRRYARGSVAEMLKG